MNRIKQLTESIDDGGISELGLKCGCKSCGYGDGYGGLHCTSFEATSVVYTRFLRQFPISLRIERSGGEFSRRKLLSLRRGAHVVHSVQRSQSSQSAQSSASDGVRASAVGGASTSTSLPLRPRRSRKRRL